MTSALNDTSVLESWIMRRGFEIPDWNNVNG